MGEQNSLGNRLRSLRAERKLSQRELARLANMSPNNISLIERDEISPSVATLQNLAAALQVRISYFFEEEVQSSVSHVKKGQRPVIDSLGVRIEGTGQKVQFQEIEPFYVALSPKSGSGERQVVHPGHEFVYCQSGKVEYLIDGKIYVLEAGDFLLFEAALPHIWRNPFEQLAEFILIIQTPNESREPVQRHFSDYPSITHIGE
jgi:transcriptional regulator with XRE-family HTH domain